MAHTFLNLGFETAGAFAGDADGWEVSQTVTLQKLAGYDEPAIGGEALEDFEENWLSNQSFLFVFLGLLQDLFPALYDDPGAPESFEDFEEEWSTNEFYALVFADVPSTAALYDSTPQAFEDYEEEWLSNENFVTAFVGIGTDLTAAQYDPGNLEAVEDFEEQWANDFPIGHNTIIPFFQGAMLIVAAGPTIDNQGAANFITLGFIDTEALILIKGSASNGGSKIIDPGGVTAAVLTVGSAVDETTPATAYIEGGNWLGAAPEFEDFAGAWTEALDGF